MSQSLFDPLSATASDLQQLLKEGTVTSVQIVEEYRKHIEKYNEKIRAIVFIPPNLSEIAQTLDDERKSGKLRGPLHGIPIIVKVRIQTQSWCM
jgi:amidase